MKEQTLQRGSLHEVLASNFVVRLRLSRETYLRRSFLSRSKDSAFRVDKVAGSRQNKEDRCTTNALHV